ncbi:DUF4926 domain-containing protein [Herbaspirillum camelliae]|uniref:DUF4926 domain-containing protein n=1 Tax=Herbaspirillum camelliae TaxID=1892903 RepID=UPI000949F72A|nr:DUF4926 domain-containing protein [Herbaspirillum camelliae]
MKIYRENEVIFLRHSILAEVVGEARSVVVHAGACGTIVLVHDSPGAPLAYEVEFQMKEQDCYALATIELDDISTCSF